MGDFEELLKHVWRCSREQKQRIFQEIRDEIQIHPLEREFNARAEVILEAIRRSNDLTKRGIRGVIAEATFVIEILPQLKGWMDITEEGNFAYDAHIRKGRRRVRIQVKMQRKKDQRPMKANEGYRDLPADVYVVEVQRTRGGKDAEGRATRPYRFGEFDLLAVCMEPSTRDWRRFMYAVADHLQPDPKDAKIIRKFQAVPEKSDDVWTDNLEQCLKKLGG